MNWLTNIIRPKIRSFVEQKEVPDNLWQKCPSCEGMLFTRDLVANMNVCYHCNHHMKISVKERLKSMFDNEKYKALPSPKVPYDPLKFKDRKRYADRLRESRGKTGEQDAIIVAEGKMGGVPVVIAAFNFAFMGGSMGTAVGEGIVTAADLAVRNKAALIVIPASGGARMQEGMLSLMQMPRSIVAVEQVKSAGLPYIVLLTDPTTGGVSASFAMVGDIHIAEPGTTIGFAGKRVIQETIREELPEGFQTAEHLLKHGMVDMVVPRQELRNTIIRVLRILFHQPSYSAGNGDDEKKPGRESAGSAKAGADKAKTGPVAKVASLPAKDRKPANTNKAKGKSSASR